MITSITHKGLRLLFEEDDASKVQSIHAQKLRSILTRLDNAEALSDLNYPGSGLHPLKGSFKGFWAVKVDKNYRVIFIFTDNKGEISVEISDVDYIDYH
jgi:proteic killer suppression protein